MNAYSTASVTPESHVIELQHAAPPRDKTPAAKPVPAKVKAVVAQLWDYQTRVEMEPSELNRYATAKRFLREQCLEDAREILSSPEPACAEALNLLGVIQEACSDFDAARKCYGTAASIDRECWAAKMNARRLYELHTFGHSRIPMYL